MYLCIGLTVLYFWLGAGAHNIFKHYPEYDKAALFIELAFWPIFLMIIAFMDYDKK